MKYRIVTKTSKTGKKVHLAQVKIFGLWAWLWYDGRASLIVKGEEVGTRGQALDMINLHFERKTNPKKQTIEFEYITKEL